MTTTLDKYGRILIPKKMREAVGLTIDTTLQIKQKGNQIIIELLPSEIFEVNEHGFLLFKGQIEKDETDWILEDREARAEKLLGI